MERNERDYMTAKEAGAKWGMTSHMVANYARAGRIKGARLDDDARGRVWWIPRGTKKPERKSA